MTRSGLLCWDEGGTKRGEVGNSSHQDKGKEEGMTCTCTQAGVTGKIG